MLISCSPQPQLAVTLAQLQTAVTLFGSLPSLEGANNWVLHFVHLCVIVLCLTIKMKLKSYKALCYIKDLSLSFFSHSLLIHVHRENWGYEQWWVQSQSYLPSGLGVHWVFQMKKVIILWCMRQSLSVHSLAVCVNQNLTPGQLYSLACHRRILSGRVSEAGGSRENTVRWHLDGIKAWVFSIGLISLLSFLGLGIWCLLYLAADHIHVTMPAMLLWLIVPWSVYGKRWRGEDRKKVKRKQRLKRA